MASEEKEFSFKATVGDIVFHIWSRKAEGAAEGDIDTYAHMHYHSEFHYVYDGTEKITRSDTGEVTVIGAGDFCIIPGSLYHTVSSERGILRQCFFLDIEYNDVHGRGEHSDYYLFSHILGETGDVTVYRDSFVSAAMNEFRTLTESGKGRLDMQRGLMLISSIVKAMEKKYLATSEAVINKSRLKSNAVRYSRKRIIEEYITNFYMEQGGISELAKILYLSPRQTQNVVKSLMGEDFKTLIVRQRINTARALMKTSDLTLDEISREIGYNSYSGFYMAYVKLMGRSPDKEEISGEED